MEDAKLKQYVVDCLSILLKHNTLGDTAYESRYKGFSAELDFVDWLRKYRKDKVNIYAGGYLVPPDKVGNSSSLDKSIYFTISQDPFEEYVKIYDRLSGLNFIKMFYIQWDDNIEIDCWQHKDIFQDGNSLPVPTFKVYIYKENCFEESSFEHFLSNYKLENRKNQNKIFKNDVVEFWNNKLKEFNYEDLKSLYVQRLFFDGYIGLSRVHGKPSDIDLIILNLENNKMFLLEIKEKDLAKSIKGFGLDTPRITDMQRLKRVWGDELFYIVRHINNQYERKFQAWKLIEIDDFVKNIDMKKTIEGGKGMRSKNSSNPTIICSQEHFKTLK